MYVLWLSTAIDGLSISRSGILEVAPLIAKICDPNPHKAILADLAHDDFTRL